MTMWQFRFYLSALGCLGALALVNCTGGDEVDLEALRTLGADYTAAWNSGDPSAVAEFFEPSGSLKVNDAEAAVGRDAIAEVAEGFMTAFPDMILTMDSVHLSGTAAEYHWTFSGTNTGPGRTGKRVRFSGYEEWTLSEGGGVVRSLGHFDEAEYNRQLEFGVDGA